MRHTAIHHLNSRLPSRRRRGEVALRRGSLAIGALAINRMAIKRARIERLSVGTLEVDKLIVHERESDA